MSTEPPAASGSPQHLPLYLAKYQPTPSQRRHFGVFIPYPSHAHHDPNDKTTPILGCQMHVIGNPMSGFVHEFKRAFNPFAEGEKCEKLVLLGYINGSLCSDGHNGGGEVVRERVPRSGVEREAVGVEAPRGGQDVLERVDGVKNRRCQEWTMEFLKRLVVKGWVEGDVVEVAEGERDEPGFGVGLRKVGGK
ncbi:hypothetical protein BDZ85DRAFT_316700 [Elsinoe ampelina]|uniref:Uncharacterized protein n=1 Tax=Elsinoe ampelina TaxID=302913 RepID=A0A6A6GIP6_9PEZI|nr:hypothetical protein BDZ85DRAFT_316700 [Elsinoe ampelina]